MKRIFFLALVALFVAAWASAQTPTVSTWARHYLGGRLIASGSYSWTLTTLQADTDSSIVSTVCDITGSDRLPGYLIIALVVEGAVGGDSSTRLDVTSWYHFASTDAAGLNARLNNRVYMGTYGAVGAAPFQCNITYGGTGTFVLFPMNASGTYIPGTVHPRYMSFTLDKEGNGRYTAGTATLYWKAYAP